MRKNPEPHAAKIQYRQAICAGGSDIICAMDEIEGITNKLAELRTEHRDLDHVIDRLTEDGGFNQIQVQRLKKRKLSIKDQITSLENQILPDIIA